jgi:UDP-N-acetylmuramate dehydrogenase
LNSDIIKSLRQIVSEDNLITNEPMSRHTTFRSGGPATLFLRVRSASELSEVKSILDDAGEAFFIIGNGSNLLVSDKGYDGAVISLELLSSIALEGECAVRVEAGALNSSVAAFARDHSLTGFEFAAGIPGTIGGAMIMNAGAYGGEMKMITKEVKVLSPDGQERTLDGDAMEFGYRTSAIKGKGFVVLSALLTLEKGDQGAITDRMTELALKRKEKQPLEYPSAGSTFKRPEGYFAGKLIEDAHLRGYSVGGAAVSDKHCGFVINRGDATSSDIYRLIQEVKERVYENSGVTLEPEVIMIGDFT